MSFFNGELNKLLEKKNVDGDPSALIVQVKDELKAMKEPGSVRQETRAEVKEKTQAPEEAPAASANADRNPCYKLKVFFEEDCQMENIKGLRHSADLNKIITQLRLSRRI
jgi:hypothetical protein